MCDDTPDTPHTSAPDDITGGTVLNWVLKETVQLRAGNLTGEGCVMSLADNSDSEAVAPFPPTSQGLTRTYYSITRVL